jgi:glutathione S-transferase
MEVEADSNERVLYGFWISPYMALVAHVLEEAGIPYRYERPLPDPGGN